MKIRVRLSAFACLAATVISAGCKLTQAPSATTKTKSVTIASGSSSSGSYLSIVGNNTQNCAAADASLRISLVGLGHDVKACMEYVLTAPNRAGETYLCDSESKFVDMTSRLDTFDYNATTDTWNFKPAFAVLANHLFFVPGDYVLRFHNGSQSVSGSFSIRDPYGDLNSCKPCSPGASGAQDGALVIPPGFSFSGTYSSVAAARSAAQAAGFQGCITVEGLMVYNGGFPPCMQVSWVGAPTSCTASPVPSATPTVTPTPSVSPSASPTPTPTVPAGVEMRQLPPPMATAAACLIIGTQGVPMAFPIPKTQNGGGLLSLTPEGAPPYMGLNATWEVSLSKVPGDFDTPKTWSVPGFGGMTVYPYYQQQGGESGGIAFIGAPGTGSNLGMPWITSNEQWYFNMRFLNMSGGICLGWVPH